MIACRGTEIFYITIADGQDTRYNGSGIDPLEKISRYTPVYIYTQMPDHFKS